MKPTDDNLRPLDDAALDMLADGELGESERGDLLRRLDHAPDGWRRCALAFLEAQCWKAALRGSRRQGAAVSVGRGLELPDNRATAAGNKRSVAASWKSLLTMAVSFLLALGLGAYVRGLWSPDAEGIPPVGTIAQSDDRAPAPARVVETPDSGRGWRMLTLPVGTSPQGREFVQVPCREGTPSAYESLDAAPSALPPDLVQALRRAGHEVNRQRQLLSVELDDGQRVVVPVDQFELRYVGNHAFQ